MKKTAGLLAITAVLAACSGALTSENPVKQHYLLEPWSAPVATTDEATRPTLVLTVDAVPGLDSDRIQAIGTDARLNHYANARWADFLPEVLNSVMRRSLQSSNRFSEVKTNWDSGDWSVGLEVQQFYGIQDAAGATIRVDATFAGMLRCNEQAQHLHLSASSPVAEQRLSVIVNAHQQALNQVTRQLLDAIEAGCH